MDAASILIGAMQDLIVHARPADWQHLNDPRAVSAWRAAAAALRFGEKGSLRYVSHVDDMPKDEQFAIQETFYGSRGEPLSTRYLAFFATHDEATSAMQRMDD